MNIDQYKHFLAEIKQEFQTKLTSNKTNSLSVQEVSQMLYRYTPEQPLTLRDLLLRGTGKTDITWDDLLRHLQEQISIREEVKKIEHCPTSATEIIESHQNEFAKLILYIKQKETNSILIMTPVTLQKSSDTIFLVCLQKQLVFFDLTKKSTLSGITFSYSKQKMKEKLFEKEEQKRIHQQKIREEKRLEYLDKVQNIRLEQLEVEKKKQSHTQINRMLTSHIRSSNRGSVLSSQHSSDKIAFRRQTESNETKRKSKSSTIRIKNDDVSKIFQIFQNTTVQNSIIVARAFTEARSNFHKFVTLQKSVLQKEKAQNNYHFMSEVLPKTFKKQLQQMKFTSYQLSKAKSRLKKDQFRMAGPWRKFSASEQNSQSMLKEESLQKLRETTKVEPQLSYKDALQIVYLSLHQHFLLVSLFNRQIRLLKLRKGLMSVKEEVIFQKQFKSIATYLQLYKNANSGHYRMILLFQKGSTKSHGQEMHKSMMQTEESGSTQVAVFHLDDNMQVKSKAFQKQISFSAKFEPALPFGGVLYNQKGSFCIIELNNLLSKQQQKLVLQTILFNSETGYLVSINEVRAHKNLINLYICCSSGYIYLFDRLARKIKYFTKANPSPAIDMLLIKDDKQLVTLFKNGNMVILSTLHLQKIFLYQSYHEVSLQSKFLSIDSTAFCIYARRNITNYLFCQNQERQFNNSRPVKIFKNRLKLQKRQIPSQNKQKKQVYKVIEGKGGKGDFVSLLLEHGQICFIDPELQYIGSYHSLRVNSIVDIVCNDTYQFIAILFDNNQLEVVNLYTQHLLFTVILPETDFFKSKKPNSRTQSVSSTVLERQKTINKSKLKQIIVFTSFFKSDLPDLFLSVITQTNNVYHYSEKGFPTATINLQKSCGDIPKQLQIIYQGESLVMITGGSLTVLHRQSYFKKCVIEVTDLKLLKIKRAQLQNWSGLICLDNACRVYLVDIQIKKVKLINPTKQKLTEEICLFNTNLLLQLGEQQSKAKQIKSQEKAVFRTDIQSNFISLLGEDIIQINKQFGRLFKFSWREKAFKQFSF